MSKWKKYFLLLILGIGHASLSGTMYIASSQYVLVQSATQYSDVQMGQLIAMMGIVSAVSYLFGGVITDMFRIKNLIIGGLLFGSVCLFGMATLPSFRIMLILQFLVAFAAIFIYFLPQTMLIHSLFSKEEEGRAFGIFFMLNAIVVTIIGLISSRIIVVADSVTGFKAMVLIAAGLCILSAVILFFTYKDTGKTGKQSKDEKFQFKYVLDVIKMPAVWLIVVIEFSGYLTYLAMAYSAPLLTVYFGVSVAAATVIATLRTGAVRIIMAPVGGIVIDKLKSATKTMLYILIIFTGCLVAIGLMPYNSSYLVPAVALVMILASLYAASSTCWFTPITEAGIPDKMRGTASGIICALAFSSDLYGYTLAGSILEKYGDQGYRYIFLTCLVFAVIGIAGATVLIRYNKRQKAKGLDQAIA